MQGQGLPNGRDLPSLHENAFPSSLVSTHNFALLCLSFASISPVWLDFA